MRTVADMVRAQRQAIAEANSNYRYEAAQGNMQSAAETATLRASMASSANRAARASSFGELMEMRAKNDIDAQRAFAKKMSEPCPTGYARNSMAECAVVINQGLQRPTEYQGPTLLQNIESYNFMSDLKRSTRMNDASVVSTLQGIGFMLPDIPTTPSACAEFVPRAKRLLEQVNDPNNCALFSTPAGRVVAARIRAALGPIITECSRPQSMRQAPAAQKPATFARTQRFDTGLGMGMKAARVNPEDAKRARYKAVVDGAAEALNVLYASAPGLRGPCVATATPPVQQAVPVPLPTQPPVVTPPSPVPQPPAPPIILTPPEKVEPKQKDFIKKYWWVILVAGGAAWYTYGKK